MEKSELGYNFMYSDLKTYLELNENAKKIMDDIYPRIYCFGKIDDTNKQIADRLRLTIDVVKKSLDILEIKGFIIRETSLPKKDLKTGIYVKKRKILINPCIFGEQIHHNALTMNQILENIIWNYNFLKIYLKPEALKCFETSILNYERFYVYVNEVKEYEVK